LITGGSLCIDFPCINADGVASGSSSVPDGGATAKLPTDHHSADAAAADEKLTMKKAIIVGGSMAGLLAGNILIRQGWHVEVLERTREGLEARGAGIVPQRSLLAALKRAGVTVRADIGIRITKRVAYDRAGNAFATHYYDQYSTSWSLLYNLLRDAFPAEHFHAGRNVTAIEQHSDGAVAILDDGTKVEGDLLIDAEGMRSVVRRALFPEVQPRYAGYLAWRGMLEERHATPTFVESCFSALNFSFPEGEELIGYPVAGPNNTIDVGRRRFNIMWYRPVAPGAELRDMFTGTDGVHHETGIPPGLVRPELIAAMKADAHRLLPPAFADVIGRMEGMFVQAIYDLESNLMGRGRVAIIGDAAFVARPHCGAGVSKAAEDAASLATALSTNNRIEEAIAEFSAERTKAGAAAVEWAAHLGSYFQMDRTGHRRAEYAPDRPPISPEYSIAHTGIELSEVRRT
jgi:2-polyprenyl-6-methoxyphenol hydroxylase-like FAD-dependent oxidoreductase